MEVRRPEGPVNGPLRGESAMDEVDFPDGPFGVARVGFVLDGGVDEGLLGLGKASSDAAEGEVGGEGALVGVEAEVAAVFFN